MSLFSLYPVPDMAQGVEWAFEIPIRIRYVALSRLGRARVISLTPQEIFPAK